MAVKSKSAPKARTVTGLPENTEAALTYLFGWITGLIFLLMEKDNKKIRFHAMQSIITFGVATLVTMVPVIGWMLSPLIWLVAFILWLVLIVKAYQGEMFKLPVIGDFAAKQMK
jgi:uncharacterized membrane protein